MGAPSDKNEIYLSSSPHFSAKLDTQKTMLAVIIALLPLCVSGFVYFGLPALTTIVVAVISCFFFEFIFRKILQLSNRTMDFSSIVTGILLALVLPPTTPVWMTILGSFFAVVVAKEFFGGLGMNVFNPALTGRAFLFVSFPLVMGTWLLPYDTITGATPLAIAASDLSIVSSASVAQGTAVDFLNMFLGNRGGAIGETNILFILIGFVFLLAVKIIDWRAPVAMVASCALFTWIFGGDSGLFSGNAIFSVLSGGLLFGAVFMTTDYATAPVTAGGRLVFGFCCGLITWLIRQFSSYPEGVMFSILIMNSVTPFLNRIIPKKYGFVKPKKEGSK
ncbi:MAG: RnfABCDGE type electron transport complex subunit D [Treponemataceae bacterium]